MGNIEDWLNQHTFKCPILNARISLTQCEAIRKRPTLKEHLQKGMPVKNGFRPEACDDCKIWKEVSFMDKRVCQKCGAEFKPYKHGCVTIERYCKNCLKEIRVRARRERAIRIDAKKLQRLLKEQGLLHILANKAKQELRDIEAQMVYEIREALKANKDQK